MISTVSGQQPYTSNVKVLFALQVRSWSADGQGSYSVPVRECDYLEDPDVDRRIILKRIFSNWDGKWNGLIWLRIGRSGGLL